MSCVIAAGLALIASAAAAATPFSSAQASPPSHFSEPVNFRFPLDYYTDLCGFPVVQTLDGTLNTTLRYDGSGNIVSEIDTQPGTTVTFSSPTSGKSISWPFADVLRTDYTNGAALGSDATSYGSGLGVKVPGVPAADSGRIVFDAVVVDSTSYGVPIVAFEGVISVQGRASDGDAVDAAVCAALAA
jgi:YD repeat-containing protein